jgi:hypothetical protein
VFLLPAPQRIWQPAALFSTTLLAALLGFGLFFDHLAHRPSSADPTDLLPSIDEEGFPSVTVARQARWAIETKDHRGLPFLVIDKGRARLFAFDGEGRLRASTPVLLGAARSDRAAAPATPAGRFIAEARIPGPGGSLVWLNGDAELKLHAPDFWLAPGRALQRLASSQPDDKRISDGSLHVPPAFFQQYLRPLRNQRSVAYVLPEP